LYGKSRLDNDSNHPMGQLTMTQDMPTTNTLIDDLHSQGLAMRRGGAGHMIAHGDANNDDDETTNQTKKDQSKAELDFLRNLPKKTRRHLVKRLQHLELQGALRV
jgi:hypothetical protein